jgi:hypothetical protein
MEEQNNGKRFLKRITLGEVLVILSIVLGFLSSYRLFEYRIQLLERNQDRISAVMEEVVSIAKQNQFLVNEYVPRVRRLEQEFQTLRLQKQLPPPRENE